MHRHVCCQERANDRYQEDALSVHTLSLLPHELQLTLSRQKPPHDWKPESSGPSGLAEQVLFFGIYDGHGGSKVSNYLKDNLPALIEGVQPEEIGKLIDWTMNQHKGYYKRWRGGGLHRWSKWAHALPPEEGSGMTLEERLTLAFLKVSYQLSAIKRWKGADIRRIKQFLPISKNPRGQARQGRSLYFNRLMNRLNHISQRRSYT